MKIAENDVYPSVVPIEERYDDERRHFPEPWGRYSVGMEVLARRDLADYLDGKGSQFLRALCDTILAANAAERERLARGFAAHVAAADLYRKAGVVRFGEIVRKEREEIAINERAATRDRTAAVAPRKVDPDRQCLWTVEYAKGYVRTGCGRAVRDADGSSVCYGCGGAIVYTNWEPDPKPVSRVEIDVRHYFGRDY